MIVERTLYESLLCLGYGIIAVVIPIGSGLPTYQIKQRSLFRRTTGLEVETGGREVP